jgi:drug/metabolite transporter superfamily protein YnfA
MIMDKKRLDKYEIISSLVAVLGSIIIFYSSRGT